MAKNKQIPLIKTKVFRWLLLIAGITIFLMFLPHLIRSTPEPQTTLDLSPVTKDLGNGKAYYENKEYGFSIEYPRTLTFTENGKEVRLNYKIYGNSGEIGIYIDELGAPTPGIFTIHIFRRFGFGYGRPMPYNSLEKNFDTLLEMKVGGLIEDEYGTYVKEPEIEVDGVRAVVFKDTINLLDASGNITGTGRGKSVLFEKDGKVFDLQQGYDDIPESVKEKVFQEILSSFKFKSYPIVSLRYTDSNKLYSIEYPSNLYIEVDKDPFYEGELHIFIPSGEYLVLRQNRAYTLYSEKDKPVGAPFLRNTQVVGKPALEYYTDSSVYDPDSSNPLNGLPYRHYSVRGIKDPYGSPDNLPLRSLEIGVFETEASKKIFEQILSTLKFTE